MPKRHSKHTLRRLRNDIPIAILIADILGLPHKTVEGYFRFLCPLCDGFNTATNPKTNLARCFTCQQNFNPIDLAMIVNHQNFRDAVQFLLGIQTVDVNQLCTVLAAAMAPQTHIHREP